MQVPPSWLPERSSLIAERVGKSQRSLAVAAIGAHDALLSFFSCSFHLYHAGWGATVLAHRPLFHLSFGLVAVLCARLPPRVPISRCARRTMLHNHKEKRKEHRCLLLVYAMGVCGGCALGGSLTCFSVSLRACSPSPCLSPHPPGNRSCDLSICARALPRTPHHRLTPRACISSSLSYMRLRVWQVCVCVCVWAWLIDRSREEYASSAHPRVRARHAFPAFGDAPGALSSPF